MRRTWVQCPSILRCAESLTRAPCPPGRTRIPFTPQSQHRHNSDDRNGSKTGLYDLLFPEEHAQERSRQEQERRMAKLRTSRRLASAKPKASAPLLPDETPSARKKRIKIAAEKRVLTLRGASKHLAREDFLRLIPPGKNLEGWVSDRSYVERIVVDRELRSLERTGTYYLIFRTAAATAEYQKRAIRLSKLLNFHGPPARISEQRIPSDLIFQGEDVRTLLRAYNLTAHGAPLKLYQPPGELPPEVASIAAHGGLPQIVGRPDRSPAEVAVRLPLSPVTKSELVGAIARAERERNLPWTGSEYGKVRCEDWPPKAGSGSKQRGILRLNLSDYATTGDALGPVGAEEKRSVFVVGLQSEADAHAFARYWHRRTIPLGEQHSQPPVIVEADVL